VLLTPGGGRWTLNLADGRPARIRLRGRDAPARPELVTDPAELERLLGVIAEKNPRAARFIPIPRRPDGRLDPDALDAALRHGFCIVRWHLAEQGWRAYAFAAVALIGLPPALKPGGEGIIARIAQTFLQLVLLSIIIVGQNIAAAASDARAENTFKDAEAILSEALTSCSARWGRRVACIGPRTPFVYAVRRALR
jgi:hypothetical protein